MWVASTFKEHGDELAFLPLFCSNDFFTFVNTCQMRVAPTLKEHDNKQGSAHQR